MTKKITAALWLSLCFFLSSCAEGPAPMSIDNDCSPTVALSSSSLHIPSLRFDSETRRFLVKTNSTVQLDISALGHSIKLNSEWQVIVLKDGVDPTSLVNRDVLAVEPDYNIASQSMTPSDPGFKRQWAHQKVSSLSAWDLSRGSKQVVIAIIDGGIEYTHPDLVANMWHNTREVHNGRDDDRNGYIDDEVGWDFLDEDADPRANLTAHIHGTHVAGIIGAVGNNNLGVIGHVPNVRLMSLKYIGASGTGLTSNAVRAIDYAVKNGADIINASWSSSRFSQALYDAIVRARAAGVLVVVASGNDGQNIDQLPRYPASFGLDNIVSVGASTNSDSLASFSNFGLRNVDVVAPGISIYSTRTASRYSVLGGTSMAAPLVSAVAALVKARHPHFTYKQIAAALFLGVDRFSSLRSKIRHGRVNAYKTLQASDDLARGHTIVADSLLCPPRS